MTACLLSILCFLAILFLCLALRDMFVASDDRDQWKADRDLWYDRAQRLIGVTEDLKKQLAAKAKKKTKKRK